MGVVSEMKDFHFSKTYFKRMILDDSASKIRIVIKETPSLDISEEEYSLRIETRHEEEKVIHRKYAIEHHRQEKHHYPHLQFNFHTEEIGTFRIKLEFNNQEDYKKAILGFVYKIKSILGELEKHRKGITEEILVLELVDELYEESKFLNLKISESIAKQFIEFEDKNIRKKINRLNENPLLIDFLGKQNIQKIIKSNK